MKERISLYATTNNHRKRYVSSLQFVEISPLTQRSQTLLKNFIGLAESSQAVEYFNIMHLRNIRLTLSVLRWERCV